jgi:hypothetical protein
MAWDDGAPLALGFAGAVEGSGPIAMMSGASLHDSLGQIARVVHIDAVFEGHEVGE